uniref:Glycylpeptide N-tetradecanoyltransferase n=1 Tax=Megaselia scalaris TaxID=36166 RepID=T1GD15_MEGSC
MTLQRTIKLFKLPDEPKTKGFRKIQSKDMNAAHKLLDDYLKKFKLCPVFTKEEFRHWFTPREGIIDLPSSVMQHPVHKTVRAAYSFYNVSTKTPWLELMNDALISARNIQMDVFNALDLMDNKKFLVPLKFGTGDGDLQYYLYNWKCPPMNPEDVALILM